MRLVIQACLYVLLGYVVLIVHSTALTFVSIHPVIPNLLLPLVVFLGVSPNVPTPMGSSVAFLLGYLMDSICGMPMGLYTFTFVVTYVIAKGAGLRLFLRGPLSEIMLTFLVSVLAGCLQLAMRAIFEYPAPFPARSYVVLIHLLAGSVATAVLSPVVFYLARMASRWRVHSTESTRPSP